MVRTSISALGWDLTHATTIKKPLPMIILIISAGFLTLLGNAIVAAPTVADFAELPMFSDLEISPGGRFLAARVNNHNIYTVAIFDIAAPRIVPVYKFAENEERTVRWFQWVTPEHLLVSLLYTSEPNELYVASNHEGDPTGLYLFDIEADEFSEAIFQHPTVDISSIYVDYDTGKLDHINFVEDSVKTKYFSRKPIEDDIATMLRSQFAGLDAKTVFVTEDGDHAVIRIQAADYPGSYYLFDRKTPKLRQLPAQYPGLSDKALGTTFATSYEARDGLVIPAFVTLPPGMKNEDSAAMIPFVILPHGGPGARDFLRFDYWVQFLATRGYGVLQMNFRGSTGYGQSFKHAGNREWGQAMQDDITDGVNWLIKNE